MTILIYSQDPIDGLHQPKEAQLSDPLQFFHPYLTIIQMARCSYMKLIKQWIEEIPDSKLEGGIPDGDTAHKDKYMRLDNQRTITMPDGSMYFNLQVQVNYGCPHTTLVKLAPDSVASVLRQSRTRGRQLASRRSCWLASRAPYWVARGKT
jgi:hypothetical protein